MIVKWLDGFYFALLGLINTPTQKQIDSLLLENMNWYSDLDFITEGGRKSLPDNCGIHDAIKYNQARVDELRKRLI